MISQSHEYTKIQFLKEFMQELSINYPKFQKHWIRTKLKQKHLQDLKEIEETDEDPFDAIQEILRNEEVQAIECPGPERFLVIKKSNKIKVINFTLSEQEIYELIMRYSQKLNQEIPKTIFSISNAELEISGVISKHAGSRFVIEKLNIP